MTTITQILHLLRAGARAQAWAEFEAGGWAGREDAEARLLRGRLVKEDAICAAGAERKLLFLQAASDYAAAAQERQSTYALINAASLALLGGDHALAERRAAAVLAMLDSGLHEPDTAYWLAATRAEAVLLLDRAGAARDSLAAAIAASPRAWEDHAVTLCQFALLLEALGEETAWLETFRPRPVLHFSGIIGIDEADSDAAEAVAAAVARLRPSAGFGALAAGGDILVAEALQRADADLHLVLPCAPDEFKAASVATMGAGWAARFDRLLDYAASIEVIAASTPLFFAAVDLAEQAAMGAAIGYARTLATVPVALRIAAQAEPRQEGQGDQLWRAGGFGVESVVVRRAFNADALPGGAGEPWSALLAAGGSEFTCPSLAEAIAAAERLTATGEASAGLDLRIEPEARAGRARAAALGAAEVAPRGTVAATRVAKSVAQLHNSRLCAVLVGEIQTAFGVEEIWRLQIPAAG